MSNEVKTVKQVCKCEKCGNESEMVVTCSLEEIPSGASAPTDAHQHQHARRAKGSATCTHCGNEADMWIDL